MSDTTYLRMGIDMSKPSKSYHYEVWWEDNGEHGPGQYLIGIKYSYEQAVAYAQKVKKTTEPGSETFIVHVATTISKANVWNSVKND